MDHSVISSHSHADCLSKCTHVSSPLVSRACLSIILLNESLSVHPILSVRLLFSFSIKLKVCAHSPFSHTHNSLCSCCSFSSPRPAFAFISTCPRPKGTCHDTRADLCADVKQSRMGVFGCIYSCVCKHSSTKAYRNATKHQEAHKLRANQTRCIKTTNKYSLFQPTPLEEPGLVRGSQEVLPAAHATARKGQQHSVCMAVKWTCV